MGWKRGTRGSCIGVAAAMLMVVVVPVARPDAAPAATRTAVAAPSSVATAIGGDYQPLAGDFDGDGRDDVFLYAPGAAQDSVAYASTTRGTFTKKPFSVFGSYRPFVGDFDNDGRVDIFWYAPGSAADSIWFGQANRTFTQRVMIVGGDDLAVAGDFNCDGRTDIVWYSPSGAGSFIWTSTGAAEWRWAGVAIPPHAILRAADFNGDGCSDLLVYVQGSGADEMLLGASFGGFAAQTIDQSGEFDPIVGNFEGSNDRNYRGDIFWYARGSAPDQAWYSQFPPFAFQHGGGYVNGSYAPAVGDFDGDGQTDILWLNPQSTHSTLWFDVRRDLVATDGVRWARQVGTTNEDAFLAVAADGSGGYYAVGGVNWPFPDDARPGVAPVVDTVVAHYDADGAQTWQHEFGASSSNFATGVAVDENGNAFVAGSASGQIPGSPESTHGTFLAEYTPSGTRAWIHQYAEVAPTAVAAEHEGGGYIAGPAFVLAFGETGQVRWERSIPGLGSAGVAVGHNGDAVVAAGPILARFTYATGSLRWGHFLGTSRGYGAQAVAVDPHDNADVVGTTEHYLPGAPEPYMGGGSDAFVTEYDANGTLRWAHRVGSSRSDDGSSVGVDPAGDVLVGGDSFGAISGAIEGLAGDSDAVIAKFGDSGDRGWVHEFGGPGYDFGTGVAFSGSHAAIVGRTDQGVPLSPTADVGGDDAFIATF